MSNYGWEVIYRLVKTAAKREVKERGGKIIDRLVKTMSKSEMGNRRREMVY